MKRFLMSVFFTTGLVCLAGADTPQQQWIMQVRCQGKWGAVPLSASPRVAFVPGHEAQVHIEFKEGVDFNLDLFSKEPPEGKPGTLETSLRCRIAGAQEKEELLVNYNFEAKSGEPLEFTLRSDADHQVTLKLSLSPQP